MPNPCPETRWENTKGETFIVDEYWFWSQGDSIVLRNESTGKRFEIKVEEFKIAFEEKKLTYARK